MFCYLRPRPVPFTCDITSVYVMRFDNEENVAAPIFFNFVCGAGLTVRLD